MKFRVLGPLDVRLAGETLALGGGKQRAVLAVLLLRAEEVVSVQRLIDEVWGDEPPPSAAHTLESYISRLRQLFREHGPRVIRKGAGYALELGDATLDAREFVSMQEQATIAAAMDEPAEVVGLTGGALAMWRGPALADVALASAGRAEADRLEELRRNCLREPREPSDRRRIGCRRGAVWTMQSRRARGRETSRGLGRRSG